MSTIRIEQGDCLDVMARLIADGVRVHSVVCDPPYHLTSIVKRFGGEKAAAAKHGTDGLYARASKGFMGKQWDGGDIAFRVETWRLAFDLLLPGGHLIAFSGTRTYHRMACAIEDAGFEIRDQIGWLYGSGFPKSHDVSKGIDKSLGGARERIRVPADFVRNPKATGGGRDGMEGATRPWIEDAMARGYHEKDGAEPVTMEAQEWAGWGTALKPAWEPIVLGRRPLDGTVAANVLEHGTGALNIDASRIQYASSEDAAAAAAEQRSRQSAPRSFDGWGMRQQALTAEAYIEGSASQGRWPANVIHDGSDEVLEAFPDTASGKPAGTRNAPHHFGSAETGTPLTGFGDAGTAARFFYNAKADAGDRLGSKHPTVKPVDLMAYLCRLVTPPGGLVLDPFAGSGTTGMACMREGFDAILIEREAEYVADIRRRLAHVEGADTPLFAGVEA